MTLGHLRPARGVWISAMFQHILGWMERPAPRGPEPGAWIAGKYRIGETLASGGMGIIVAATHAALDQPVAIKLLLPETAARADLCARFLREARAAARLRSPHAVRVFDVGADEEGAPFMVMERLTGHDLAREMELRGALPVEEAAGHVVDALDAIVEAHAAGIVHRDLKPSNLFLVEGHDGARRVVVLDFGISKIAADAPDDPALTASRSMLGSPRYMSPEQVRSARNVDARTDVWALGVILYELLSGAPAFQGETLGDLFAKIREEDLPAIRRLRPDVPEELDALLGCCLERDRDRRLADAAVLRARLLPFTGRREVRAGYAGAVHDRAPSARLRHDVESAPTAADDEARLSSAPTAADDEARLESAPTVAGDGALVQRGGPQTSTGDLGAWTGERGGRRRNDRRLLVGVTLLVIGAAIVWKVASSPGGSSAPAASIPPPIASVAVAELAAPAVAGPSALSSAAPPEASTPSAAAPASPPRGRAEIPRALPRPALPPPPAPSSPPVSPPPTASPPAPVPAAPAPPAPAAPPAPPLVKKREDLGI